MDLLKFVTARLSEQPMTDMMVDVETTGTNPAHGAMIQLAAIKFNYDTGEIGGTFNRCLTMPPGRFWDDSTRQWWGQQKPEILQGILARAEDPRAVMEEFMRFATDGAPRGGFRFWSKPLSFDWGFVASYCAMYGFPMPFAFWQARDMRSFIAGLRGCPHNVDMDHVTLVGDAHNALYDCALQLKQLFAAKAGDWLEVNVTEAA